ncbi:hypothetical protein G6O69_05615 [Pseudenhygromyxa sp. WMMC2535]|uniref:hypothetical protein n=1 Tax=Pseudenhygromyxa sp. WMMC2535 TaxID=2712867 RepID=UPI001595528B|nr:hypothetical protein [Pseudenhygromyxa sp. WMMC2535]NVB37299.1 hypothetical protein [Pseudenhygromyxa sp. WMMC2535]
MTDAESWWIVGGMFTGRSLSGVLAGLCSGLALAALVPGGGCVFFDYCIRINYSGTDWCTYAEGALMWPEGQPDLAVPVSEEAVSACVCFNDVEVVILEEKAPEDDFAALVLEIEQSARDACADLVPAGFSHNCDVEEGPDAMVFGQPFTGQPTDACVGSCEFINPPPGGSCRELDPYECNDEEAMGGSDTEGGDEAGG